MSQYLMVCAGFSDSLSSTFSVRVSTACVRTKPALLDDASRRERRLSPGLARLAQRGGCKDWPGPTSAYNRFAAVLGQVAERELAVEGEVVVARELERAHLLQPAKTHCTV